MKKENIRAIIFDIDGTLTDSVSWTTLTFLLGSDVKIHTDIFDKFKSEKLTYKEAKSQLIELWRSTGKANKVSISEAFKHIHLKENVYEVVFKLSKKYKLCLISGSMDLYVQKVAKSLDIKDWYANTKLIFNADLELIDFDYTYNQSAKKLQQFYKFTANYNLTKNECAIVGDGDSDTALMKELRLPILYPNERTPIELLRSVKTKIKSLNELLRLF